jgi:hypothetical protein
MDKKEIAIIILSSIILALTAAFKNTEIFYSALLSFLIIIFINVLAKKIIGFYFETEVKTKFWTWYQFGLRKDMHFKNPIPMLWLPLLLTLFTKGNLLWLTILEFDIKAKAERVSKRHGIYRFTQVTEWHMAWIAIWGLIANLILAIIGYTLGFELLAKLSIYYIAWNTIPLSRFDGAKIFYASKPLWTIIFTIAIIVLGWSIIL